MKKIIILLILLVLLIGNALAHGDEDEKEEESAIGLANPVIYIVFSLTWLAIFSAYLLAKRKDFAIANEELNKEESEWAGKKIIFWIMITPVILATLYLSGYTIYENLNSISGGPVHWHADYQVWACGEKLDLIDPEGISNRIGSAVFHEHDDNRIHIEGTITDWEDINLGEYFEVLGGELSEGHVVYPTVNGIMDYKEGDACNNDAGSLKVYVNGNLIEDYENYLVYPDSYVPPGDCIIVKFDSDNRSETDILCDTWASQGWNYDSFVRREAKVGNKTWQ